MSPRIPQPSEANRTISSHYQTGPIAAIARGCPPRSMPCSHRPPPPPTAPCDGCARHQWFCVPMRPMCASTSSLACRARPTQRHPLSRRFTIMQRRSPARSASRLPANVWLAAAAMGTSPGRWACQPSMGLGVVGAGPHTLEEHLMVSCLVPRTKLFVRLFETLGAAGAPCGADWPHLQAGP